MGKTPRGSDAMGAGVQPAPAGGIQVDAWEYCYSAGWKGICVEEAFTHPAKFSRALIQRIYQHVREEGWLSEGQTVLDCFAGTGLGARDAMAMGARFVGVELEEIFHNIGAGCDCTGITPADWVRFAGRWDRMRYKDDRHWCPRCMAQVSQVSGQAKPVKRTFTVQATGRKRRKEARTFTPLNFPDRCDGLQRSTRPTETPSLFGETTPTYTRNSHRIPSSQAHHYEGNWEKWARQGLTGGRLIRGDSRELGKVLEAAQVCVSSPPYANGLGNAAEYTDAAKARADAARELMYAKNGKAAMMQYSTNPHNLGNLPPGSVEGAREGVDCSVSSPPYNLPMSQDHNGTRGGQRGTTPSEQGAFVKYGSTAGQLEGLPSGNVQAVISSPPFSTSTHVNTNPADMTAGKPLWKEGTDSAARVKQDYAPYATTTEGQLAAMPTAGGVDLCASSPPYEASDQNYAAGWKRIALEKGVHQRHSVQMESSYGVAEGQMGNTQDDTFWSAAKQVLEGVYRVLRPGGHAVWVVKGYVRDGELVDFPGQWAQLCRHVGFELLHEHHAMLTREYGTQVTLAGEELTIATSSKSFFRRLCEAKGAPEINFETVLCMVKPLPATPMTPEAAWEQLPLMVSSPPFSGTEQPCASQSHGLKDYHAFTRGRGTNRDATHTGTTEGQLSAMLTGSVDLCLSSPAYGGNVKHDYRITDEGGRDRDMRRGYRQGLGCFRGSETYGGTEGNLGAMPDGNLALCLSSPPYTGADEVLGSHNGIDWTKTQGTGQRLTPGRGMYPYGKTEGQLGAMPPGTPLGGEE